MAFKEIGYRDPETIKNQITAEEEADEIADARHAGTMGVDTKSESVRIQNPITGRTTSGYEHEQYRKLAHMLGHSKVTKAIVDSYIGTTEWRRPRDSSRGNQGMASIQKVNEVRARAAEQEFEYAGDPPESPDSNVVDLFHNGDSGKSPHVGATAISGVATS